MRYLLALLAFLALATVVSAERFPINLIDAAGEGREGALIIAYLTGTSTPVDTAYEQGDGNYWFEVSGDSGWTPGFYDIYYDVGAGPVLPESWTNVYIGFGNVPALNSVDSTRVADRGLSPRDIALHSLTANELAAYISLDSLKINQWGDLVSGQFWDDWTFGDAVGDTFRLLGTAELANTSQQQKVLIWQNAAGKRALYFHVLAGQGGYAYVDSGDATARFLDVVVDSTIVDPASGGFFVSNLSDSAAGYTSWNWGANAGIYSFNFHAQGEGIKASADMGTALGVMLNHETNGYGIRSYVEPGDGVWGSGTYHYRMDVTDTTQGLYVDMSGPETKGIRIDRYAASGSPNYALTINNQTGGGRCVDINNTATTGTLFAIRGEGGGTPYAGNPPVMPGDSAIVDIRVGPVSGGSSSTHSGIRMAGTSAAGKPPVRILDRGATGNGGALKVDCAPSATNSILATFRGGISWNSGIYARSAWYDEAAADSTQWAGTAEIPGWHDCDTLAVGNLSQYDIFIVTRRIADPAGIGFPNSGMCAYIDSTNHRVVICRADTASANTAYYSWLRIRRHANLE